MPHNKIKVFAPNSKRAEFDVLCLDPENGVKRIQERLGSVAAEKVRSAFRGLDLVGADSMTLRSGNRRIKVELADAA